MKTLVTALLLVALPQTASAQLSDVSLAGQRLPLQISVDPLYQSYTVDDGEITEVSVPVSLYLPLHRKVGLSIRTVWAAAGGDTLSDLSGMSDAQAHLSVYQLIGPGSIVASIGINLPSGKQALTLDEFQTVTLLSRNHFDFRTPSFGVGMGVSPGFTVAFPLSESFVLGFGAAYQFRGAFEPLENMVDAYRPGDELLITGGFDLRFSRIVSMSADVTYTSYEADRLGDEVIFGAGDKIVVGGQLRYVARLHQLRLSGRYRSRAPNRLAGIGEGLVDQSARSFPDEIEIFAHHRAKLSRLLYASVVGEVRLFDEAVLLPNLRMIYGAGVGIELVVSRRVQFPGRFVYQFGDLKGFEVGVGLRVST